MRPDFRLITARLALRPVTPADRADLIALEADPVVMRYLNGGRPVPERGLVGADFLTPRGFEPEVLAAHERATGLFVGWFALFDGGQLDGCRTAELGYRLKREMWGQGFGAEGAGALVAQAMDHMGFECVRAQTMSVNAGSRRLLERIGMRHVGTVFPVFPEPMDGGELGEAVYEVRREPSEGVGRT